MIQLGHYNTLHVLRSTSVGVFLGDGEGTEVLLPNKYVPEGLQPGEPLEVFCYLDHKERPVATTLTPKVVRNGFAYLQVAELSAYGAFMDWGLEKHLLVPFREQTSRMQQGEKYVIYCYLDEKTFRLVGSSRIDRFLSNDTVDFERNAEVALLVNRKTPLGWEVIVENKHKGLVFTTDVFQSLTLGDRLQGYIKTVRPDRKIDVALQPLGTQMLEPTAQHILDLLQQHDGFLPLHDQSPPEAIAQAVQLSKKAFKKGIGVLYSQRKIILKADGIYLCRWVKYLCRCPRPSDTNSETWQWF